MLLHGEALRQFDKFSVELGSMTLENLKRIILVLYTMKNVLHQKGWGTYTSPDHVDPSPILLIKETPDGKSDGDYVKLKLCGYPKSST